MFRGFAEPFCGLVQVLFDALTIGIHPGEVGLRRTITEFGGGPEMLFRRFIVSGLVGSHAVLVDVDRLE